VHIFWVAAIKAVQWVTQCTINKHAWVLCYNLDPC
jgi:hypothetical protein